MLSAAGAVCSGDAGANPPVTTPGATPVCPPGGLRRRHRGRGVNSRIVARVLAFLTYHRFIPEASCVTAKVVQGTGEPPRVRVRVARGSFPRLLWLTVGQVNPGLKSEIVSGRGGNTLGDRNGHP